MHGACTLQTAMQGNPNGGSVVEVHTSWEMAIDSALTFNDLVSNMASSFAADALCHLRAAVRQHNQMKYSAA